MTVCVVSYTDIDGTASVWGVWLHEDEARSCYSNRQDFACFSFTIFDVEGSGAPYSLPV